MSKEVEDEIGVGIGLSLEWMEETLASVLITSLPNIPSEDQEAFAVTAAKAIRASYSELIKPPGYVRV